MKFSDSEHKVMLILWDKSNLDENGEITAKQLSDKLVKKYGWSRTSNYVYFGRLVEKGAITRRYPNYTIRPLVFKETIAAKQINDVIKESYGGSIVKFFSSFLESKNINQEDIDTLKELINSYEPKKKRKYIKRK